MNTASREYTLDVSEHFFHLTTESLRLRSNETLCYQTLDTLIDSRVPQADKIDTHPVSALRKHLEVIPTKGTIRINLIISEASANSLADARVRLASQLGTELTFGDALSILLFDYVVERKAARFLTIIGIDELMDKRDEPFASDSQEENPFSDK